MKIIELTAHTDGVISWIDSRDIFQFVNENSFVGNKLYLLADAVAEKENYFQMHSSDGFGNAPFQRLEGYMQGFLNGACTKWDETPTHIWFQIPNFKVYVPKLKPVHKQGGI